MERIALEDESVKRELQQYGFPEGTVAVCDPWIYGMTQSLAPALSTVCRPLQC